MSSHLREWLSEMKTHFQERPRRAPLYVVYSWYLTVWYALTSRWPFGVNVYERDWDVLIVLDACRVDTLQEVADEYDFIKDVKTIRSVGSQSDEWMANTFTKQWQQEIEQTAYVTGNGHSQYVFSNHEYPPTRNNVTPFDFGRWQVVDEYMFESIEMVWKHHHNSEYGVVLPRTITDYAITKARKDSPERLIVHYLQPHRPYIGKAVAENQQPTELERDGYRQLERGEATREEVYELYKETLRLVLDEVGLLLDNLDAEKVVITSDHGEAFGEGLAYGHPEGFLHPVVKRVPWAETSATDTGTYEPDISTEKGVSVDVEDHLRDLGYR